VGGAGENGDFERKKGFEEGNNGFVLMFCQSKKEGEILLRFRESNRDVPEDGLVCWANEKECKKISPKKNIPLGQFLRAFFLQKVRNR
jgi:hypothetical protein